MKRHVASTTNVFPLLALVSLVFVGSLAFASWQKQTKQLSAATVAYAPNDTFFHATGLVEDIEVDGNECMIHIAVYAWRSLSNDFPLAYVPAEGDRYVLAAEADYCNAVRVAMEATKGHIAFQASSLQGAWQMSERPLPAFGCGGLSNGWTPPPRA
ncbi:MAG: hypothetical protein AAF267_11240 [Deinococcota bacterium]